MAEQSSATAAYGKDAIVTLSPREHIRLRPGMYIGKLGDGTQSDDGIYVLLKEVVDNSIDEFIMGAGKRIEIKIEEDRVSVRDYGRGYRVDGVDRLQDILYGVLRGVLASLQRQTLMNLCAVEMSCIGFRR